MQKKRISEFINNISDSEKETSAIIMDAHVEPKDTSYNSSCTNERSDRCDKSYNKGNCQNTSGCCNNAKNFGECSDTTVKPNLNHELGCNN